MGTKVFLNDYIENLEKRNKELLNKLTEMKEYYENKIFTKEINKHYLSSLINDVTTVCMSLPQEIDLFFDEMTTAMGRLKNILLKKSEMIQLVERVKLAINTPNQLMEGLENCNECTDINSTRKSGTVKVSPMINGHVILTEPRIYLNRVSGNFSGGRRNKESQQLSPIMETSPRSSDSFCRDATVPLDQLNLNNMTYRVDNEVSPKTNQARSSKSWKGSKKINQKRSSILERILRNENETTNSLENGGVDSSEVDPQEGSSWMYNDIFPSSSTSQMPNCFVDCRRRRNRFAVMFDRDKDEKPVLFPPEQLTVEITEGDYEKPLDSGSFTKAEEKTNLTNESTETGSTRSPSKNVTRDSNRSSKSTSLKTSPNDVSSSSAEFIISTPQMTDKIKVNVEDKILAEMALKQPVVTLEDCLSEKYIQKLLAQKTGSGEKPKKSSEPSSENSSILSNTQLEGRRRRRAAPTNLSEPSLVTKLRRG